MRHSLLVYSISDELPLDDVLHKHAPPKYDHPSIANAVFRATGRRINNLPIHFDELI
jgi:hypothetical protein